MSSFIWKSRYFVCFEEWYDDEPIVGVESSPDTN
jgi:hypothetical protein